MMTIPIGNAPCSWGVLEFELEGTAAGYVRVLDEIAETGYAGTELGDWGFMPTDPSLLRQAVHARGLTLLGAFVPVMLKDPSAHAAGVEAALRTAQLLVRAEGASPFIVLADENGKIPARTQNAGRIQPEHSLSPVEWQIAAEVLRRLPGQSGRKLACALYSTIIAPDMLRLQRRSTHCCA
jgi:inosose dehydratase